MSHSALCPALEFVLNVLAARLPNLGKRELIDWLAI